MRLRDKVAIVSGAGSGIGRAIAHRYAEEGAKVVCFELNEASLDKTASDITGNGGTAAGIAGSAIDRSDVKMAVDRAVALYGTLDIMVNVVGGGCPNDYDIEAITEEDWYTTLAKNTKSTLWGCQLAAKVMKPKKRGSIINVSSVNGIFGLGLPLYALAKGGVIAFTRAIAIELGPFHIRCNVMIPGSIYTEAWEPFINAYPEGFEIIRKMIPLNRLGRVEEVAGLAVYLGSDESRFSTGTSYVLDGGTTIGSREFNDFLSESKRRMSKE